MRRLADSAVRAKVILERENAPLPADCRRMVALDLERTLSGYFELADKVEVNVEKGDTYEIVVRAKAVRIKTFGVLRS